MIFHSTVDMDSQISTEKFNLLPIFLTVLVSILSHFLVRWFFSTRGKNLPPGPFQWPLVGSIPCFIPHVLGFKPHLVVTSLAKNYGELICLKLGKQTVIIGSSPRAASAILKTWDRQFSGRYAPKATPIEESDLKKYSLVWSTECTSEWKSLRVLWKSHLFSPKALERDEIMRETKVAEMVDFLRSNKIGDVVDIGDLVFTCVLRSLGMLCFSKDLISMEDEKRASELKDTFWRFMEHSTTPIVPDFFPQFDGFDPLGHKKKATKCLNKVFDLWRDLVQERRKIRNSISTNDSSSSGHGDFLDFMITNGFSDIQIDYMLLEIIPAGLGTLTTTLEWAMAELVKNQVEMKKVCEELQMVINNSHPIKESQVRKASRLNACVKETLRLHPPIPFPPHCAQETCQVFDYTIPKGSLVLVNLWALGHDPKIWEDPFEFKIDRFLDSNIDFKGQDFELLPFSAGRRMCPGLPFAAKQASLLLASLINSFEWSLPGNGDLCSLDMDAKFRIPMRKNQPLLLVPKIRKIHI